jgi:hypothetical protein
MSLKHGNKVTLELRDWYRGRNGLWVKVDGEIVEEGCDKYLKHRDIFFPGLRPENAVRGYNYWRISPDSKGMHWRIFKVRRKKKTGTTSLSRIRELVGALQKELERIEEE